MNLRIAGPEDFETVMAMAMQFIKASGYELFSTELRIEQLVLKLLHGDKKESILLIGDGGFIAGGLAQFPFGDLTIASEIAWWVDPDKRKSGLGKELLEAFEYWAKNVAQAKMITMVSLDNKVGKIYEKNGYTLYERAYMKAI